MQVDLKQDLTFASALRAVLRQDPDVIFVGEIRDEETAAIAVQASLTGHLVLATVHANSAIGAVRRMADLGLDAASIASTLRGSMAQRLVRKICSNCAEPVTGDLSDEEQAICLMRNSDSPRSLGHSPRFVPPVVRNVDKQDIAAASH